MKLKTKFIKGTNKQYSIRNDGSIIRHYLKKGRGNHQSPYTEFKDVIMEYKQAPNRSCTQVVVRTNGMTKHWFKNSLLAEYFGIIICPNCNEVIKTEKHIRVCKECSRKRLNELQKNARQNNPELYKGFRKKHYDANIEKFRERGRQEGRYNMLNITKQYAASKLNISISLLTEELYENYKATLIVKRKLSEKLNIKTQYL